MHAWDKIWTYNLNIFRVPLDQVELLKLFSMEILGLDPKITICKIAVLPVKLYPLAIQILLTHLGIEPRMWRWKCHVLTTWLVGLYNFSFAYPKNDLNVYDILSINLKFILSTNSSTRIYDKCMLRPEWFEHSSELSWAACFTN